MNDPKYFTGPIINTASGEMIPQDEPCFIFRARDIRSISVLMFYEQLSRENGDAEHAEAISRRITEFREFKDKHPERMKKPDTDLVNQGRFTGRSEETSEEIGKIAARLMHHPDVDVRRVAASALTQRPDHG